MNRKVCKVELLPNSEPDGVPHQLPATYCHHTPASRPGHCVFEVSFLPWIGKTHLLYFNDGLQVFRGHRDQRERCQVLSQCRCVAQSCLTDLCGFRRFRICTHPLCLGWTKIVWLNLGYLGEISQPDLYSSENGDGPTDGQLGRKFCISSHQR